MFRNIRELLSSNPRMFVIDTIELNFGSESKKIELCAGDLSQVPPEWNTDFLLISAFPNDYTPTPSSVVGALSQVGIPVRHVSKNKEEDLRRNFYCWYSKPLTQVIGGRDFPFKRLMCFENPGFGHSTASDVRTLFHGLTTVSNLGSDLRVVSSLLKTGDSGHNQKMMLKAMVDSCAHWMLAGLPIKVFSIVLFNKADLAAAKKRYDPLIKLFGDLKESTGDLIRKHEEDTEKTNFDFYLSYSDKENQYAKTFSKLMKSHASSLRFYDEHDQLSGDDSWQSKMFENVKSARKVVHFLSQQYLQAPECIEQFNISYCLNNSVGSLLAPLFLDESTELPNYMKSIQWFNCHKYSEEKMATAIKQIYTAFINETQVPKSLALKNSPLKKGASIDNPGGVVPTYDVFISYAHKNKTKMEILHNSLGTALTVFLDSNELRTGFQWQQAIYESVENSSMIFALLSEDYFNSAVCREEFHLALASVLNGGKQRKMLIPLLPDDVEVPKEYKSIKCFPLGPKTNNSLKLKDYGLEAQKILLEKQNLEKSQFNDCVTWKANGSLNKHLHTSREKFLNEFLGADNMKKIEEGLNNKVDPVCSGVAILSGPESKKFAVVAEKYLRLVSSKPIEVSVQQEVANHEFTRKMDSSDTFLVLLNNDFMNDSQSMSFLNLCLLDCRLSPNKKRILVIATSEDAEFVKVYPRLISNRFNVTDPQWRKVNLGKAVKSSEVDVKENEVNCILGAVYNLLTEKVKHEVLADGRTPVLGNVLD